MCEKQGATSADLPKPPQQLHLAVSGSYMSGTAPVLVISPDQVNAHYWSSEK